MNTRKQVLVMSVLLLMMLIIVALYGAWYPSRAEDAETNFQEATAFRGAITFSQNCRLCHGDVGEGGSQGGRLAAAPPLDRQDLQGFKDSQATLASDVNAAATTLRVSDGSKFQGGDIIRIGDERMAVTAVNGNDVSVERNRELVLSGNKVVARENSGWAQPSSHISGSTIYLLDQTAFDRLSKDSAINLITNTIACGRVGTFMPAWSSEHGGPLSDEQIRQLTVLIMFGRWDLVEEENDIIDRLSARLTRPLTAETFSMAVSDVTVFNNNQVLRLGEERLRVTGVPQLQRNERGELPADRSGVISVQRGVLGTVPLEHPVDTVIYNFPEAPEPSINQSSCGQTARPTAVAGPCTTTPEGVVQISAQGIAFNCNEIRVQAGSQVRIAFENREAVLHNVAVYISQENLTPVAPGSVGPTFTGPNVTRELTFTAPAPGSYFFRCDVHPTQMTGTFTVQ